MYPSDVMKVFMTKFVGMIQSTGLDGDEGYDLDINDVQMEKYNGMPNTL